MSVSLTAIIRAKAGSEAIVRDALVAVAAFVAKNEPDTLSYFVTEVKDGAGLFITHERFRDTAAMEHHNAGDGSKAFFKAADGHLAGVDVHIGTERISAR